VAAALAAGVVVWVMQRPAKPVVMEES
jgi:hypothetical protein